MNWSTYMCLFMLFFVLWMQKRNDNKNIIKKIIEKRNNGGNREMLELAKQFINKECIIYTFNSQVTGTITEVIAGAIKIEDRTKTVEIINLDYVVRIREYPTNKNGKKKSVVLD